MKKKILILFLMAAPFITKAQSQKVYMPFFEVINMNWQYQYSVTRLLQTYTSDNNRYELVLPAKPDSLTKMPTTAQVQEKARALQAPFYATGELNRIGETVIVSFNLYKTADGTRVWSDRLKANTPDDLDPIMKKLANKMGTVEKATKDDDMYNVTSYDGKELNKIQSTNRFGFTLAGGIPFTGFVNKALAGFGIVGSYDTRNLLMDIRGMYLYASSPGGSSTWMGSLEAYYPMSNRNITPFIGGGVGISTTAVDYTQTNNNGGYGNYSYTSTQNGSGLMLILGGGWLINRNSSVNLRVGGNLFSSWYEINSKYIAGGMLRVEILY